MKNLNRILKPLVAAFAALSLTFSLTSCGDTHEGIVDEACNLMEDMASEVDDIKDADSATDAEENLNELVDKLEDLAKRAKALDDPPKEVQKELDEQMEKSAKALERAMTKVASDPERAKLVMPIMIKIGQKMEKIDFDPKK